MRGRTKLPESLAGMLRSQVETAIAEANLGEEDTLIAQLCIISRWPHADIAAKLRCDRSTVSKRVGKILEKVERTAEMLKEE